MIEYPIELKKEAMAEIEEIKEPNESLGSVTQRAFQLLYYFTKQRDAGFTEVFLRNPEKNQVRKMEIKYEEN
jgi:hypothetical protein